MYAVYISIKTKYYKLQEKITIDKILNEISELERLDKFYTYPRLSYMSPYFIHRFKMYIYMVKREYLLQLSKNILNAQEYVSIEKYAKPLDLESYFEEYFKDK